MPGLGAPWHVGSSFPRPGIKPTSPCIGRHILNHGTAREVPLVLSDSWVSGMWKALGTGVRQTHGLVLPVVCCVTTSQFLLL